MNGEYRVNKVMSSSLVAYSWSWGSQVTDKKWDGEVNRWLEDYVNRRKYANIMWNIFNPLSASVAHK